MTIIEKIKKYSWIFVKYFSMIFFSFVSILPIVSCLITAFKTDTEYQNTSVMTLPESWFNFQNFIDAFNKANMGRAFLNSIIVVVVVVGGSVMIGSMLAYVLNRFKFPGNGLIRNLFLFATLLPGIAMQVSTYQLMYSIGFINHLYGYIKKITPITKDLTENIYKVAFNGYSLANECEKGIVNEWRIWWVQAETVVGFINGYQKTGNTQYLEAASSVWNFIKENLIDKRSGYSAGREWYWRVSKDGVPDDTQPIVEPWKCPYHNGRMCFEVIRRLGYEQ